MKNLKSVIEQLALEWITSDDSNLTTVSDINNGLCADFANAVADIFPKASIVGVYDSDDLSDLPGIHSDNFKKAVSDDLIGHTAIFFNGLFYDSESPSGVIDFEDLLINRRTLGRE